MTNLAKFVKNFFSVFSSPVTFCILGEKSAWEKKSAWEPGSQVLSYYAGLIHTIPGALNIFKRIAWQKNFLHPHYQNVHKKCLAKKCSLHPHVPRHILHFQKKCLAKSVIYFRTYPGT